MNRESGLEENGLTGDGFGENVTRLLDWSGAVMAAVLSQALGVGVEASGAARAGVPLDGLSVVFQATGGVEGTMAIGLNAGDAFLLARTFTGAATEGAAEPNSDDREALEELWRQVMGELASRLRPVAGEVRFELLPEGAEQPRRQVVAIAEFTLQGRQLPVTIELGGGLVAGIAAPAVEGEDEEEARAEAEVEAAPESVLPLGNLRPENLKLLLDVELSATLRFGQKQMRLSEILQLSAGAVIDLDREVQEPIELLVDGRLIARGEAVIVDGNYGMRVTELAAPGERLSVLT